MLTLKDILSHLTYVKACKLLGPQGEKLIWAGGKYDIDLTDQVRLKKRHRCQAYTVDRYVSMIKQASKILNEDTELLRRVRSTTCAINLVGKN